MSKGIHMIGDTLWIGRGLGPMTREALEAVGCPSGSEEVRIEIRGDSVTIDGRVARQTDAALVYNAWRCDPHRFVEEPSERVVRHTRRAITIRALLPAK